MITTFTSSPAQKKLTQQFLILLITLLPHPSISYEGFKSIPFVGNIVKALRKGNMDGNMDIDMDIDKDKDNDSNGHLTSVLSDEGRETLGDIYCNERASSAYKNNQLNSLELTDVKKLRVIFRNQTPDTLLLCWSGHDGILHHFYRLEPCTTIVTSVAQNCDGLRELQSRDIGVHMESTFLGHTFVLATKPCTDDNVETNPMSSLSKNRRASTQVEKKDDSDCKETIVDLDKTIDTHMKIDSSKLTPGKSESKSFLLEKDITLTMTEEKDSRKPKEAPAHPDCMIDTEKADSASKPLLEDEIASTNPGDPGCLTENEVEIESSELIVRKIEVTPTETKEKDVINLKKKVIDSDSIIAAYRPRSLCLSSNQSKDIKYDEGLCMHIVTVTRRAISRKRKVMERNDGTVASANKWEYQLTSSAGVIDDTPIDTSEKEYTDMTIGGWPIKCEKDLFACDDSIVKEKQILSPSSQTLSDAKERIKQDLEAAALKLPPKVLNLLRKSTPIWINKSQQYGPKCVPVSGRGMCFHPSSGWLEENGMSTAKCGCVELFETCKYLDDVDLWYGKGGIMLHELAHAWHNKFLKDGYSNEKIETCYKLAMEEKLYDSVKVHQNGGKTGKRRAYACTDPMEYFAELSVAYLGGVGNDKNLEFNKWFPFNRKELKEHDPRAYKMLQEMWDPNSNIEDKL